MKKSNQKADKGHMKTTKKPVKKFPKPEERSSTRIVLEHLLPFLNLSKDASNKELFNTLKGIASDLADSFSDGWFTNLKGPELMEAWEKDQKILDKFREAWEFARNTILSSTLHVVGTNVMSGDFKKHIAHSIESALELDLSFYCMSFNPNLDGLAFPRLYSRVRGSTHEAFKTQADFNKVWVPGLQAIIFYYLTKAYDLSDSEKRGYPSPIGWHYIGFCHKEGCGKIFRKTRSNQDFCSVKCGNLARDKKRREKLKPRD